MSLQTSKYSETTCCLFDVTNPEEGTALPSECTSGYSNSRPCEIGLSLHGGSNYQSIVYLVDSCTEKVPQGEERDVMLESTN